MTFPCPTAVISFTLISCSCGVGDITYMKDNKRKIITVNKDISMTRFLNRKTALQNKKFDNIMFKFFY